MQIVSGPALFDQSSARSAIITIIIVNFPHRAKVGNCMDVSGTCLVGSSHWPGLQSLLLSLSVCLIMPRYIYMYRALPCSTSRPSGPNSSPSLLISHIVLRYQIVKTRIRHCLVRLVIWQVWSHYIAVNFLHCA